jgi:hypothetical protein
VSIRIHNKEREYFTNIDVLFEQMGGEAIAAGCVATRA